MKKLLVLAVLAFGMIACSDSKRESLEIVEENGLYGVINKDGETVLPIMFESICSDGPTKKYLRVFVAQTEKETFLFSEEGKLLLKGEELSCGEFWKNEKGEEWRP